MKVVTDLTVTGRGPRPRGALPVAALFRGGATGLWIDPSESGALFQDTAGTIPATQPGAAVARVLDLSGSGRHATQGTVSARPALGRHPASGLRNLADGAGAPSDNTRWRNTITQNGVTATRIATGTDPDGPWAIYQVSGTASATSFLSVYLGAANSRRPATSGQTYTTSAFAERVGGTAPPAECGVRVEIWEELTPGNTLVDSTQSVVYADAAESLRTVTRTLNQPTTNQVRCDVVVRTKSGATVDYQIKVKALQFEPGESRTAFQLNLSQFDVTEAGQRDLWYLSADGVDDVLTLASALVPAGDFTLAAAMDAPAGLVSLGVLGSPSGGMRFGLSNLGTLSLHVGFSGNRTDFAPNGSGRQVGMIQSVGAGAAAGWRNGVALTPSLTGAMRPVDAAGFDRLFREGAAATRVRLYGLLGIERSLSAAERLRTTRHLAHLSGVTLP